MVDLHRHDECSSFDGYGKPEDLAKIAKELGYTSLGITNHGNTNSLVKHYFACKENGIKPIMGVETYFLPAYKEKKRGFHLCLFAKNNKGYSNMNRLLYEGEKQKYYNAIITFELLEKYHEGIICSSACIAGFISQCIVNKRFDLAEKAMAKFKRIFGDDFYVEIQPYKISEAGLQENVNYELMKLAHKLKIKCILTSDSHYGYKHDFDTYLKMHEIAKHDVDQIRKTYGERYMPTEKELKARFCRMFHEKLGEERAKLMAKQMLKNMREIEDKVDGDIFDNLKQTLPTFNEKFDSMKLLKHKIKRGLERRGKYNKEYVDRIKKELEVIKYHGFENYFLIVADYSNWAKKQGIMVGPGRGSGCNCLTNYALGITDVDPIKFDLDFYRFLRIDKKKMPDIDLDFETARRGEVIEYLLKRYAGHSAQICSYGLYRVDNLINELAKTCNVDSDDVKDIKMMINSYMNESVLNFEAIEHDKKTPMWNAQYDNIIKHFIKLYNKVRFIGTHAAGVAIVAGDIFDYTTVRIDNKTGKQFTAYDLNDLEKINVIKFDLLGLTTMSSLGELRKLTDHDGFNEKWTENKKILRAFSEGDTEGVFQFEKGAVQDLLKTIHCDTFGDVVAASSLNRPGPLTLGMPSIYGENKMSPENIDKSAPYYKYIESTYGCIIYQEQVQAIAVNIGGLEWPEADKIMKMSRGGTEKAIRNFEENHDKFLAKFKEGAKRFGMSERQSEEVFDKFFNYSFNKGHSTGYSLVSVEEMYYKVYHPAEFWFVKMKYCGNDESKLWKYRIRAVQSGVLIFTPQVNRSEAKFSISHEDGVSIIQEGFSSIKNVGLKAAETIVEERNKNGPFKDKDDFIDRVPKRSVNSRTISALEEAGALNFNEKSYMKRVEKYNAAIVVR